MYIRMYYLKLRLAPDSLSSCLSFQENRFLDVCHYTKQTTFFIPQQHWSKRPCSALYPSSLKSLSWRCCFPYLIQLRAVHERDEKKGWGRSQGCRPSEKQLAKERGDASILLPALSALSALSFVISLWAFSFGRLVCSQSIHAIGEPSSTMDHNPPHIPTVVPG